jgi:integrase
MGEIKGIGSGEPIWSRNGGFRAKMSTRIHLHLEYYMAAPGKIRFLGRMAHTVDLAGLWGKVTPHTLRHTAATWLMQRGVPIWQAAGFLGMSAEVLERTYGHHHPDYMRAAAHAIGSKQSQNVSLVIPLVRPEINSAKQKKG